MVILKIRDFTGNNLAHAIDCISQGDSPTLVSGSMGAHGGYVALVLKATMPRPDVKGEFSLVMTLLGKAYIPCLLSTVPKFKFRHFAGVRGPNALPRDP
jgi:hypothetical protein